MAAASGNTKFTKKSRFARDSAQRRARCRVALGHRIRGDSYSKIAEKMQINQATAWAYVRDALDELNKDIREKARELQRVEALRIDEMMAAIWEKATDGDLSCIATVVKLMERRAKLFGLDAPAKTEIYTPEEQALVHHHKLDASKLSTDALKELIDARTIPDA